MGRQLISEFMLSIFSVLVQSSIVFWLNAQDNPQRKLSVIPSETIS